jgi:hypothetical protein
MSRAGEPAPDTRLAPGKRRQEQERLEISQYGGSDVVRVAQRRPSATPYSPPGSTPSSMSANSCSLAER